MFRMGKWARIWANNVEITTERVKVNKKNEKHWNNSISRKNHGVIFICPNFRDKFHGRPKWKVRCDISFDILRRHISPSTLGMAFLGCWFRSNLVLTFTLIIVPCRIEWNVLGTSFSVVFYDFEYVSFCLFGIIFISFVSSRIYEWAKWRNANTHIPKEPFVGLNFHIKSHQNLPPFSTWVECVLHNACYVLKWFAFRSFIFTRVAFLHRETKQVKCFKYSNSSGEILFLSAFRFYYCAWCWMLDLFISQHSVVSARSFATYSEEYFYLPGFV